MARRKRSYSENRDLYNAGVGLTLLFAGYMYLLWFTNRPLFFDLLVISICAYILILMSIVVWYEIKRRIREARKRFILETLKRLGMESYIENFINQYGFERKKNGWSYRDHSFDWERLKDLRKVLNEKGLHISESSWQDLNLLLRHYIQLKEEQLTRESIGLQAGRVMSYSDLSGTGFENLLYRLFGAMGYVVQRVGGVGDQGGDLVANKGGKERILIQAKRYDSPVGNSAVQQAVGAEKYYSCSSVMVVTNSGFTREALDLAKVNNVALIGGHRLSELLLQYLKEDWR